MRELTKFKIREADKRIGQMPFDELNDKIDLIYSLGYVYNPYVREFFNPFINQGLKAMVVYNLDLKRIKNLHEGLEVEYIEKNKKIRTAHEIESSIFQNEKSWGLELFISSISGILSLLFFLTTIVAHIMGAIEFATISLSLSFILINSYLIYNLLVEQNEDEFLLSSFWLKSKKLFIVFSLLLYPYLYYLLYLTTNSFWIPVLIIFPLQFLIRRYIVKKLGNKYWQSLIYDLVSDSESI